MGTGVRWLIGSSTAVMIWLVLLWAERTHDDRQERKDHGPDRRAVPPRRSSRLRLACSTPIGFDGRVEPGGHESLHDLYFD